MRPCGKAEPFRTSAGIARKSFFLGFIFQRTLASGNLYLYKLFCHRFIKYDEVLVGTPDYFVSKRSELGKTVLGKPLLLLTEAKKNDFDEGWAQCLAEMITAQKLNANELIIYGVVTDGQVWQFGKLERDIYTENEKLFTLDNLAELLGALDYIHQQTQEQIESLLSS